MLAQSRRMGKTRKTFREGERASATSSQTTPTKSAKAKLCARAAHPPQIRRKIAGSASQQIARIEAPRQRAKAIASMKAEPTAAAWPRSASFTPPAAYKP